ncbi:MAG: hypothetical protein QOI03_190, partial [Solirubrobacteraceae bacterium]|nr:hypothetical protein [Solirubrobacteraceae bacterium]
MPHGAQLKEFGPAHLAGWRGRSCLNVRYWLMCGSGPIGSGRAAVRRPHDAFNRTLGDDGDHLMGYAAERSFTLPSQRL